MSSGSLNTTDDVLAEFVRALRKEYAGSIVAVIFYGSCMRTKKYRNAILDFYVVVDKYRTAYKKIWPCVANKLLPPNVYFLQVQEKGVLYQAKYAVVSQTDLDRHTSEAAFHSYFWARFAQPFTLEFVVSEDVRHQLTEIQEQALTTMIKKVSCMVSKDVPISEFWVRALRLTYAAELRAETKDRAQLLYDENKAFYEGLDAKAHSLRADISEAGTHKFVCRIKWRLRILIGKGLSILRLLKATTTFVNGIDYIAWKIRRHTGEEIQVSDRLRKFPWIFCWPILWRLYRSGKVR